MTVTTQKELMNTGLQIFVVDSERSRGQPHTSQRAEEAEGMGKPEAEARMAAKSEETDRKSVEIMTQASCHLWGLHVSLRFS